MNECHINYLPIRGGEHGESGLISAVYLALLELLGLEIVFQVVWGCSFRVVRILA